jgi:two-component system sensor histidine kinase/response regulator
MVQRKHYDLVLMDMQMPVMDGVTATIEIRKLARYAGMPIVAMTANAMQRDRERCLAAGMNGFVTKPINPDELCAVLLKWIKPQSAKASAAPVTAAATPVAAPAAPAASEASQFVSVPGLDTVAGLRRMMGKKSLYLAMLKRYVDGQRNCAAELRHALDHDDWPTAERMAHTAKGVAGNIGAVRIPEPAQALELAIHNRAPRAEVDQHLQQLEDCLAELIGGLDEALSLVEA